MFFNKKTQIWYFDFIMGVTIFTLILIVAFRFVTSDLYIPGKETNAVLTEARRVSETILTSGIPVNWSEDTVLIPGIIDEGNVLNITKLEKLINMTNKSSNKVKQLFGIKSDFLVYFEDMDNNILWSFDNFYMSEESLTDDLVSHYAFSDNTDSHGSYDLTEHGDPTYSTGKVGNAVFLDGTDDYHHNSGLNSVLEGSMSVCGWFNSTTQKTYNQVIFYHRSSGVDGFFCQLRRSTDVAGKKNEFYCRFDENGVGTEYYDGTTEVAGDSTYHFGCLVADTTNNRAVVYYDGSIQTNTSKTLAFNGINNDFFIGDWGVNSFFYGQIDDLSIWNRALDKAEMDELYNLGNGLTYPFTIGSGATINDVISLNPEKIITIIRYVVYKHDGISEIIAMKVVLWQE